MNPTATHSIKLFALAFVSLLFCTTAARASLGGTYTIDPASAASSTNYKNFTSAVSDMLSGTRTDGGTANGAGVSSAVVFNVANGTYTEQITISAITGASATNTVTFQSAGGDSSKVILTYASSTSSTNNFTLYLNGAQYVTFSKMTISRTGTSTYGGVILLANGASYDRFLNNKLIGIKTTSTTASYASIVYDYFLNTSPQENNNTYKNNYMRYGVTGFYCYGYGSASLETGTQIQGNTIDSTYYYGMYLAYQDAPIVRGNRITNLAYSSGYGIYFSSVYNGFELSGNYLNAPYGAGYGFYMSTATGTSSAHGRVFNNMVSINGVSGVPYALGGSSVTYTDIVFNSVNQYNSTSGGYALYLSGGSNVQVYDNIFAVSGGGMAGYISASTIVTNMDYNDWYSANANFASYNGTTYTGFSAFRTATGKDANSINVDPQFYSSTDLHAKAAGLYHKGTPFTGITTDFDGDIRNATTPTIGADEFTPASYDVALTQLVSPNYSCIGTANVSVRLMNAGLTRLDSVRISWLLDGVLQSSVFYKTSLNFAKDTVINIGSISLNNNIRNLVIYTSSPNSQTDANNTNDTLKNAKLRASLSGTYTIGGSGASYSNFTTAVKDLISFGVCGPVTFNVANGTYNEQIVVTGIIGASSSNTITFQSAGGDSTAVILQYPSSTVSTNNYTLSFDAASYVTFRKMTLSRTGVNTYGTVIEIKNGCSYINILSNRIYGVYTSSSTSSTTDIYNSSAASDNYLTIKNNLLKYGSYGMYMYGLSASPETGTWIEGNIIDSAYGYGIYTVYQNAPVIRSNSISRLSYTSGYGIYLSSASNALDVTRNYLYIPTGFYGIYLTSCTATASAHGLVANNMISMAGTSAVNGIYLSSCAYQDIFYNSINITNTSITSRDLYLPSSTNVQLFNNIFSNLGGGLALEVTTTSTVTNSNYNDFFVTGTTLGKWGGTSAATLSSWQTTSGKDANSVSAYPYFVSNTNLHALGKGIDGKATPLASVTIDFDGNLRDATTPDIGADEFSRAGVDADLLQANIATGYCPGSSVSVDVKLYNAGNTQLDSVYIKVVANGVAKISSKLTLSLKVDKDTSISLGSFTPSGGTDQNVKVYTYNPNGGSDVNTANDTITTKVYASLSGTYTIGGSGANYSSFSTAAADLKARGVCGAVIFNVADGTYTDQVVLNAINGASSSNTITFQSASGDSSKVILQSISSTSSTNNFTLSLDAAKYITFKKIGIWRTGSNTYGTVIEIKNGCSNINLLSNYIKGANATSSTTNQVDIYNTSTALDNNLLVKNNYIKLGSYAIYISGVSSSSLETGNQVEGNVMDSTYANGVYTQYQDAIAIRKNSISNLSYTSGYGIYANYDNNAIDISRNYLNIPSGYYGIYMSSCTATTSAHGLVSNNMISMSGTSAVNGIYLSSCSYDDIFYNSINITNTSASSRDLYLPSGTAIQLYNNIFANSGGGLGAEITSATTVTNTDYNDWYITGTVMGKWGGTSAAALSNWKTTSGKDVNSVSLNPKFFSSTNLHLLPLSPLDGLATPLTAVTTDFDGELRNAGTPDIGADEFVARVNDLRMLALVSPSNKACGDSNTIVGIVFQNIGTSSQSSFGIGAKISGTVSAALSGTYSKTLASEAIDTFYFSTRINTYKGGVITLKSYTGLSTDSDNSNDTLLSTVTITGRPDKPVISDKLICGPQKVKIGGSPITGLTYFWYTSASASNPVAYGDTLNAGLLAHDTTYYVELKKASITSLTTTFATNNSASGNMFNITPNSDLNIDSLDVHISTGPLQVRVYYKLGTYVGSENNASAWTFFDSALVTGKGSGIPTRVPLHKSLKLSAGTLYGLYVATTSGTMYYTNGANTYSDENLTLVTGNGNSYPFVGNNTPRTWNGTIYYRALQCASQRVAVKVSVGSVPAGASLAKGSTFGGAFNAGTLANPDLVCSGQTLTYSLTPPSGYSNGQYGATWTVSNLVLSGAVSSTVNLTAPSSFGNGLFTVVAGSSAGDSLLTLRFKVKNSATGCDSVLTRYIRVYSSPTANFSYNGGCGMSVAFTNNSTGSVASYLWSFGDGNTSAAVSPTYIYSAPGTYTVKLVISTGSGCKDSVSRTITINASPQAAFTATNECAGSPVSIVNISAISSGSIASYQWTFGDGSTSTVANPAKTYVNPGTYSIKLLVVSNAGCKDSVTKTVNIYAHPQGAGLSKGSTFDGQFNLGTSSNPDLLCALKTIQYTISTPLGLSNSNYGTTWTISRLAFTTLKGTAAKDTTFRLPSASGNGIIGFTPAYNMADSTFIIDMTVKNLSTGCDTSFKRYVTTLSAPQSVFSYSGSNCQNNAVQFKDSSKTAGATASYSWDFGDGGSSTQKNPTHIYTAAGSYTVKLTVAIGSGCSNTSSKSINILPGVTANFSAATHCADSSVAFTNSSTVASGSLSYLWSFGDGSGSTSANPSHAYATGGAYSVKLVATSNNGCKDSVTKTITVNPKPQVSFTSGVSCASNNISFSNSTTVSAGSIASYLWKFGDGSTSTSTNPLKSYSIAGNYTVTLIATTDKGCKDSASNIITVNPSPSVNFAASNACTGNSISFSNSSTVSSGSISSYLWKFGDGSTATTVSPSKSYSIAGNYTVTLIATTGNGCTDSVKKTVTVYPRASVNFNASNACTNTSISFANSSSVSSGSISSYLWKFGDGTTSTAANPGKSYTTAGTYNVWLLATTDKGCTDSSNKLITVYPRASVNFSASNACTNSTISFSNSSTVSSGTISSYLWSFGDGGTSTAASPTKSYTTAGTYSVKLVVTTSNGCRDSVARSITIYTRSVPNYTYTSRCLDTTYSFTSTSTVASGSIVSYLWNFGDNTTSTSQNPSKKFNSAGTFNVKLVTTTDNGCKDSITKSVIVYPKPSVAWTVSNNCVYNSFSFSNSSTAGTGYSITSYLWDFGDGNTSTLASPVKSYASAGTYSVKLTVTNSRGCIDSLRKTVTVYPKPAASFTAGNRCQDTALSFVNTSTVSTGSIASSAWDFGDGSTSTQQNPQKSYANAGTYSVKLTVTTANGCVDSIRKNVTVYPLPVPSFTSNTVCSYDSVSFTNTSNVATGKLIAYAWDFGDSTFSTLKSPKHKYKASGTYSVRMAAQTDKGCVFYVVNKITVLPIPKAAFTANTVCEGEMTSFTNMSIGVGTFQTLSYLWNFGDGSTSTDANPDHQYAKFGSYKVKLVTVNTKGCSDSTTLTIQVKERPKAAISGGNVCEGVAQKYSLSTKMNTDSVSSYLWTFGDGSTSTAVAPVHAYKTYGLYRLKLKVTSTGGCSDSVTKNIVVYRTPLTNFDFNEVCAGETTSFQNLIQSTSYSFIWSFGDGDSSTVEHPQHIYKSAGSYLVTQTVTNSTGCAVSLTKTVRAFERPKASFITVNVCQSQASVLNNTSTIGGGDSIVAYKWFFGDGTLDSVKNIVHTYAKAGAYMVRLVAIGSHGCTDTARSLITVYPVPQPRFSANNVCFGQSVQFADSTADTTIVSSHWDFGDSSSSAQTNPAHRYTSPGIYTVRLTLQNTNGCTASATNKVTVYSLPDTGFIAKKLVYRNYGFAAVDTIQAGYLWDFGDSSTSNKAVNTHNYKADGIYTVKLKVTNAQGCVSVTTKQINLSTVGISDPMRSDLSIKLYPNPFNDRFTLGYSLDKLSKVRIIVMDLSGKEVALIAQGEQTQGEYSYSINAEDYNMAGGVYIVRISINGQVINKPLVRVK